MNISFDSGFIGWIAGFLILLALMFVGWRWYTHQVKKQRAQSRQLGLLREELLQYKAQLEDLEMQERDYHLNPHLFKNTLNVIQSYAYKTHLALEQLGGVLDYILYDSRVSYTSLKEELDFLTSFIELNRFRLNPLFEFNTIFRIDAGNPLYHQKLILPLVTVDFIENAFRHGDLNSSKGFISVTLRLEDENLIYMVSNRLNPQPLNSKIKGGLGRNTLRRRLDLKYPGCYELVYTAEKDTYKAYLKLNLNEIKNKMLTTG